MADEYFGQNLLGNWGMGQVPPWLLAVFSHRGEVGVGVGDSPGTTDEEF